MLAEAGEKFIEDIREKIVHAVHALIRVMLGVGEPHIREFWSFEPDLWRYFSVGAGQNTK